MFYMTPFLLFVQRTFVTVCRCDALCANRPAETLLVLAGMLYKFSVQSNLPYALPAGTGRRYIPPKHFKSALGPRLLRCSIPPLFIFTRRGYRPFCIKASLGLGPQGCHTEVLLALLH